MKTLCNESVEKAERPEKDALAAERAAAIVVSLDFGDDFELLFNATEEDLAAIFADGTRAGLRLLTIDENSTTNEARARFDLAPIDGGDDVPLIVNQVNDLAVEWAKTRSAELVTQVSENTRDMIRGTVTQAIEEGWGAAKLADELEDSPGFSPYRAEMIARTETIRSYGQGNLRAYKESGVANGKVWSTAGDDLVSEGCQENEDEGPIDLDEDFPSGDDSPPAHPLCRCAILPWTEPLDTGEEE